MKSIKVGIDVRELQEGILTGIGRYLLNFLKIAHRYRPEWKFILFGNQNTSIKGIDDNFDKVLIKETFTFYWDQVKLPLALKTHEIDLFLSPYLKAPLISSCKKIITIHDLAPFLSFFQQESNKLLTLWLKRGLSNLIARRADLIITVSNNSKKDIIHLFNIKEDKIRVIYNGIEERFHPIQDNFILEEAKKRYGISKDYLFYVGNLKPHKNVCRIIKAYNMLPVYLKDKYQLVIVAKKDKGFMSIFKLCRMLSIIDKVIFIDFVKDNDLPSLYSAATIFVFPSFYEGFGFPALEAMACGLPAITSSSASLDEVTGRVSRLINPSDTQDINKAIEELLTNPQLREELKRKGLRQARNFSVDKTAQNIIEALEELI